MITQNERTRVARELIDAAENLHKIDNRWLCDEPAANEMLAIDYIVGWKMGCPDDYTFKQLAKLIDPTCKLVITVESLTETLTKYTSECSECGTIFGDFPTRKQAETTHPTYCPCCGSRVISDNLEWDNNDERQN